MFYFTKDPSILLAIGQWTASIVLVLTVVSALASWLGAIAEGGMAAASRADEMIPVDFAGLALKFMFISIILVVLMKTVLGM